MPRFGLRILTVIGGMALAFCCADPAFALRRVALVIGNAKYEHAGLLANTINDAHSVAAMLKRARFDVVDEHDDLGVVEMKRVVRDFTATASHADIAVVYYSGHGIEAAGVNYLIPVDARLANAYDVEDETLPLDRLLWATSSVKSLSLVILDACRENPFLRGVAGIPATRGVAGHLLAEQATTANTLVAYAAKAGSLSYDGAGSNSPFTTALVKYVAEPGVDIRIALGKVRDDVLASTGGRQEPFVYGSLGGEPVSLAPAEVRSRDAIAATAADYAMAERVGSPEAWRAFVEAHREGGFYVDLARAQLNRTAPGSPAPSPSPIRVVALPPLRAEPQAKASGGDDPCKAEAAQLAALRNDPSSQSIAAFAAAMTCSALQPQLRRLMESVGLSTVPATKVASLAARSPEPVGCDAEGRALERLRAEPDPEGAKALFDRLTCEPLRPQLRRVMESLGVAPPAAAASSQRAVPAMRGPAPAENAAADCETESGALSRLRGPSRPKRRAGLRRRDAL